MNAKISVESVAGNGSKFILTFPLDSQKKSTTSLSKDSSKISEVKSEQHRLRSTNFQSKKVLVVEDDEINKVFIRKCLNNLFEIESAKTGEQAIKLASENKFDIILMDINLGKDMDGITATQIIRKIRGYENTPIVAMTAYAAEEDKAEFLSRGCSHFLPKPFLMNELVGFVKGILSEKLQLLEADKILLN
jgi:CheY-like chemotaxis protein